MNGIVSVPETGITLAREGRWDPRIRICEVPDGDTDAAVDAETGVDGVSVVDTLLGEPGGGGGERAEADVEFGVGDFDIESGEGFEGGSEGGFAGGGADDEVGLETDTVDFDTAGLERLNEVEGSGCLCTGRLDVVIVVVELDIWVVESCGFECDWDIFRTNGVIELGWISFYTGVLFESYKDHDEDLRQMISRYHHR